jgi:hypothetical protein
MFMDIAPRKRAAGLLNLVMTLRDWSISNLSKSLRAGTFNAD